jgi:multisubunit Na+/H+ antiporter MnhG subunit
MYGAQAVGPEHPLSQIVSRLAQRANLPQPRCYVIPSASPNAFATGRNPSHAAVAATEGILQMLDERELEGVLAHELAHVRHRDILTSSIAATLAAAIMMIARMAQFAAFFGGGRDDREGSNPIALLATIIVAPLAAMLIQAAISRSGRSRDRGQPVRPCRRAAQDRDRVQAAAARGQSGDGAPVHRAAVPRPGPAVVVQHASADREADPGAPAPDLVTSRHTRARKGKSRRHIGRREAKGAAAPPRVNPAKARQ